MGKISFASVLPLTWYPSIGCDKSTPSAPALWSKRGSPSLTANFLLRHGLEKMHGVLSWQSLYKSCVHRVRKRSRSVPSGFAPCARELLNNDGVGPNMDRLVKFPSLTREIGTHRRLFSGLPHWE